MEINKIKNGYVIDHIKPGRSFDIYYHLNLDSYDGKVAIIKNAESKKMGYKDILKIDTSKDLDLSVLGFIDDQITVNRIKNGKIVGKDKLDLPDKLVNVVKCKNPRCITSIEQELDQVFILTDCNNKIYRCQYCETMYDRTK